jgi:hypothetical protein
MTVVSAWFFGGAPWQIQLPILVAGLFLSIWFAVSQLRTGHTWLINKYTSRYWFLGLVLGTVTLLQCLPLPWFLAGTPLSQSRDTKSDFLIADSNGEFGTSKRAESNTVSLEQASSVSPELPGYRNWTNSIDPIHSLAAMGSIGIFLVAFLLSYRTSTTYPQWIYPVLIVLMVNGAAMASIGIIEKLSPNGWRLLDTPVGASFGGFVSRSSAAAFLNIGLAAAVGCFGFQARIDHKYRINPSYRSDDRGLLSQLRLQLEESVSEISTQKVLILVCAIVMVVGILMSLSRGGAISSLAAMLSLIAVNLFRRNLFASIAMVILVLFSSLFALRMLDKLEIVRDRLETISEDNIIIDNGRWQAWGYAIDTSKDLWLTGGGLGNFHYSYLPYQKHPTEAWFYHAESFYLQTLSDLGIVGFMALMFSIATLAVPIRSLMSQAKFSLGKAIGSSLLFLTVSLGIHSISDFSIILPALFLPTAMIVGISFAALDLKPATKTKTKRRTPSNLKSNSGQTPGFRLKISHAKEWPNWLLFAPAFLLAIGVVFVRPKAAAESVNHAVESWSEKVETSSRDLNGIIAAGEKQLSQFPNEGELNMAMAKAYTQLYRLSMRDQKQIPWEDTLPVYARDAFYKRNRIENLNVDELLQNPAASEALKKARQCWLRAHYALPLDWRPHWGLVELDFVEEDRSNSPQHLDHLRVLARNRPDLLLTAGIASLDYPGQESSFAILKQVAADYIRKAPAVLKVAYQAFGDRAFSDDFIPHDSNIMLHLSETIPNLNATPASLKVFWDTIHKLTQNLSDQDRNKSTLLAYYYHETGDIENEYLTLNEAVNRSPMNTYVRYLLARNLILRKEFDKAETHVEFCLRQEPAKKEFLQLRDDLARQRVPLPEIQP